LLSFILLHWSEKKKSFLGAVVVGTATKFFFFFSFAQVLYENGTGHVAMVDLDMKSTYNTHVPINLQSLHPVSSDVWILGDNEKRYPFNSSLKPQKHVCGRKCNVYVRFSRFWMLTKMTPSDAFPGVLTPLKSNFAVSDFGKIQGSIREPLPSEMVEKALGKVADGPTRLFSTDGTLASIALNFPNQNGDESQIFAWPRNTVKSPVGDPLILKQNGQVS